MKIRIQHWFVKFRALSHNGEILAATIANKCLWRTDFELACHRIDIVPIELMRCVHVC